MKALVAGDRQLPADIAELARDALVVGADGGGERLLAAGIQPDAIVGDMDSLSATARTQLADQLVRDDDPGRSDLEKAVAWARAQGADAITVVGWSGGRLDHTLAALALAFEGVVFHDDRFRVSAVAGGAEFTAEPGTLFSLLALPEATISVSGARWELTRETLAMGARGLHNEIGTGGRVRIECHSGKLLLLEGNFQALHD
ncbi:MAG: thiamine diphosphokinase [Candidatus Poseidoniia archaeon]|nr:thiamine diphosphokinase [Candidatus Poseidoniia archaeon]MDP7135900.1 thiamine diphosphokinase [Candidatus Poseidoniia archaeon]